jgi:DNA (cytosine-5)-methyltransferase 1
LDRLGYKADWQLLDASDFGVSQFRRRAILVAIQKPLAHAFMWPDRLETTPPSVGEKLYDQMASRGWRRVLEWSIQANKLAPTIVGGSAKHGGPDLGPVRARKSWATLGVDGKGIADEPPDPEFAQMPRLTVSMVSRLQGFPDEWEFAGRKTAAYRQVGNAFPPAVAKSIGEQIANALVSFKLVPVP